MRRKTPSASSRWAKSWASSAAAAAATNLAWSCMNEPTCSRGWVNARLKNQPSRDRIQRMRPGSTPTSSSQPQVSMAVLPAPITV